MQQHRLQKLDCNFYNYRENDGTLGMVLLIINHISSLDSEYLLGISPVIGLLGGVQQLGYHPKGTSIIPTSIYNTTAGRVIRYPSHHRERCVDML